MKVIDYFSYNSKFLKFRIFFSLKARKKMIDVFMNIMKPQKSDEVLDYGTTPDEILPDTNFLERLYPYPEKLSICSIEDCSNIAARYNLKQCVKVEKNQKLPFKDREFDVLFSSAVLEHVGTREDQKFFIDECVRVSKRFMLTTPYRYFPMEMHTFIPFLHWLPWNIFQKFLNKYVSEFWGSIENLNLLSGKDIQKLMAGYEDKYIIKYVQTLGIKSNIMLFYDENGFDDQKKQS